MRGGCWTRRCKRGSRQGSCPFARRPSPLSSHAPPSVFNTTTTTTTARTASPKLPQPLPSHPISGDGLIKSLVVEGGPPPPQRSHHLSSRLLHPTSPSITSPVGHQSTSELRSGTQPPESSSPPCPAAKREQVQVQLPELVCLALVSCKGKSADTLSGVHRLSGYPDGKHDNPISASCRDSIYQNHASSSSPSPSQAMGVSPPPHPLPTPSIHPTRMRCPPNHCSHP